ncbi:MAG: hypothetical protein JXB32_08810, partial [Deltaproteobacteria bacterium]|nr:hypothetical protein [Deltaproteobacteria bacterium]
MSELNIGCSRRRWAFLGACALLTAACGGEQVVAEPPDGETTVDPCEGIDCSGHGTCAVTGGDTAVCLCDAGYHAEGTTCVANV